MEAIQHVATIDRRPKMRSFHLTAHLTDEVRARSNLTILANTRVKTMVLELLASSVDFTEKLVTPKPFSPIFKPDGRRIQASVDSLGTARDVARSRQISMSHVSSIAAILPREDEGVVDSTMKVYGRTNLHCENASVFPLEPLGNIQSMVHAIAERAADILKEARLDGLVNTGHPFRLVNA